MICPRCQQENPAQARFCIKCGTGLSLTCAKCRTELPSGAKFCFACGQPVAAPAPTERFAAPENYTPKHLAERILTSKGALEGERKQITVLFADVKGSLELIADRDPEEARQLLDPVLELMMEAVHRYEGTVSQVMGDGIMALFGAPLALEDHAVRACYAALRMQEGVRRYAEGVRKNEGIPIQIRVGLNSGEVVVRAIGGDLHMDYTAVGQTTHLAARMEQMALPGSILMTADTLSLAEGYIQVKPLGPLPVKGMSAAVAVYEVVGAEGRSRLDAAVARGLTRFVGRDPEMEQICLARDRAAEGRGQAVAVVGEAGVGKSRLYWEFTHSHHTAGWLVLESHSVSHSKATSYFPVIDLLKGYFHIEGQDEPRRMREKITGRLLSLDEALRPTLPVFLSLLDLRVEDAVWHALPPTERRQRTLDAIKHLLIRESQVQPVALVFEDLHWIDGETQALLDSLIDSLPTTRLLLLTNYRPEYQHGWSSKTYYRQLRIDPLPAERADDLLASLLGPDVSLEPLKRTLIGRTEGNPLFLEESVRTLIETKALVGERGAYRLAQDAQTIQVPATVQAILAARIDRLASEDKRLLEAASVIGKDVPFSLLQPIADMPEDELRAGLARLQTAEFLYETRLFPDLEYTFKHALTHELAYSSLLHERRRALHARIAEDLERLYPDRLADQIERIAHHAVRGELREKAVHYLRQAGVKAAARSALLEARNWFEQALTVLDALPEGPSRMKQAFEVRLELRPVLHQLGELRRIIERLGEAETLAERLNDERRRGRVYAFETNARALLGELDEARASGARALAIAQTLLDPELRILATTFLEQANYFGGDYPRVVDLALESLAALPAHWIYEYFGNSAPASVYDRVLLVQSLAQLGRFAEAAQHEAELLRLVDATHHAFTVGLAHWAAGTVHLLRGDWAGARSLIEHGIVVARTSSVGLLLPPLVASSVWPLAQLGQASEALSRLPEATLLLEREAAKGIVGVRGWDYHSLGRACLLLGRLDEAQSLAERAVESCPCHPGFAAHARHLLGDIATHPDRFEAARGEAHYREALALAETLGMRPLIGHCHAGLARLYRRDGKRQEAEDQFGRATAMYRDLGAVHWLEPAEREWRTVA